MKVLPRYSPTYNRRDLRKALSLLISQNSSEVLRGHLSRLYGTPDVFLFNRARTALYALMKAYGRPGEVITPAYNALVVPEAVTFAGYVPRFVDISYGSYNPSTEDIERAICARTTAVIVNHLFGIPSECDEIMQRCKRDGILVVEDAAHALGARQKGRLVGSTGDAAIVSFNKDKVVVAMHGGALIVNNKALVGKVRNNLIQISQGQNGALVLLSALLWKIATHRSFYQLSHALYSALFGEAMYEVVAGKERMPDGYVSTMSDFTAALAGTQMEHLESNLSRRRAIAEIYSSKLADCPAVARPLVSKASMCSWIQYPVSTTNRSELYRFMQDKGIDLSWLFRYSCAESYGSTLCPNSLAAARSVVGLPTYPALTDDDALRICRLIREFSNNYSK
jgi:perosamine synthetase